MSFFGAWKALLLGNNVQLSNNMPVTEATAPAPGSGGTASRFDHKHERLTSTTWATFGANNEVTVPFTRLFAAKPGIAPTYEELTDNPPIIFKIKGWTQDGNGNYTAVTMKGYRGTILPALSGIILIGPLVSALSNFNIFGGSAVGVSFSCIAVQSSAP